MTRWRQCTALALTATLGLTGCVEAWLGHPAQPEQTPATAAWRLPPDAQALVDKTLESLPPTVIDHAAYIQRPAPKPGLLAGLKQRIWADAVGVRQFAAPWEAPYVSRLDDQLRAVGHPVNTVALSGARTGLTWPEQWRVVTDAAEQPDRWVHDPVMLDAGPQAETIWLDLTAIQDNAPALALADSLARAGRTVLLLGCMRGSEEQLMECVRTLRAAPANARLFLLIDGLGNPMSAPSLLNIALQQIDLFDRLRYASAYPYPAINTNISLDRLVWAGLLDPQHVGPLRAIYAHNPWLFDVVLKRQLKLPGTSLGFAGDVFGPLPPRLSEDG